MFPMLAMMAVSAISTGLQARQASKQRDLQRKANTIQENSELVAANQQRRQDFRRERIRRAQMEQQAFVSGTTGSSGFLGSQSAIGALQGGSQAFAGFGQLSSTMIGNTNQSYANSQFRSQMIGGVASLAQAGISGADGAGWLDGGTQQTQDAFGFGPNDDPFEVGFGQR